MQALNKYGDPQLKVLVPVGIILFFLFVVLSVTTESFGNPPKMSDLGPMTGWEPTRDRNVIIKYENMEFKHHIKANPAPFPQCNGVQDQGREAWLLTQEENPYLYIIDRKPNAWKRPGESTWTGIIPKTYKPKLSGE
jgi:hypothetical protein